MSDTGSKTPKAPPPRKRPAARPKPAMVANEKLIGRSFIRGGARKPR